LTAAVIASELGSLARFTTDAQLAAFAGVAPIEASSAGATRHRLNRGGNRRLNAVLYRIVLTQRRADPRARAYIARRRADGRTLREAIRCLKRYIARAIFHAWLACSPLPATTPHVSPDLPVQLR
jgi:transposase